MKVLIVQRVLPKYRQDIFTELNKEVKINVMYSQLKHASFLYEQKSKDDLFIKVPAYKFGKSNTAILQWPLKLIRKIKPELIVCEASPSFLTLWLIIILKYFLSFKLALWGHGVKYNVSNPYLGFRGKLIKYLHKKADALLIYSRDRAEIIRKFPMNCEKTFVASNTLNTNKLIDINNRLKKTDLKDFKIKNGFNKTYNLIFVGRLLENKGIDLMLEVFKLLNEDLDIALHIIGDGPQKNFVEHEAATSENIHYHGQIYDEELLSKYLFCSDLFVMLGYVGLSIIHAFAFSCPLITTYGPDHSPEIEYLKNDMNGRIVNNNIHDIRNTILEILNNPQKLGEMQREAFDTINSEASLENFISGFKQLISYLDNEI
ncbi:glycosyltransferase family 4 protein [Saccharicrinis sp. FJH54]|uniref:glycosyltransferase family 4 protein n=1 Tax=Saccharicrinis sp. FJH54 TaxID=3344665 RepID=UPI0035D4ACFB